MKLLIKTLATIVLTVGFIRFIYSSDRADAWFRSSTGQHAFGMLERAFNVSGAEQADNLIFNTIAVVSLVMALIAVVLGTRLVKAIAAARQRTDSSN